MEKEAKKQSVFEVLSAIDCQNFIETKEVKNKKTGQVTTLSYLSWAWAWAFVKQNFPNATYTIYENAQGLLYHHDGRTAWVKTGVTIEGVEYIEYLPVMDYANNSISVDNLTSTDVNKAIQRSLTKAAARHGLGLYIYAGEDLPVNLDGGIDTATLDEVAQCTTREQLAEVWKKYPAKQANADFVSAVKLKSKELNQNNQ